MSGARRADEVLARIDKLVFISCNMPEGADFWELRVYIDMELLLLFRRASDLLGEPGLET